MSLVIMRLTTPGIRIQCYILFTQSVRGQTLHGYITTVQHDKITDQISEINILFYRT